MKAFVERALLIGISLGLLLVVEGGLRLVGYGSAEYGALDFGIPVDDDIYVPDPEEPTMMQVADWVFEMQRGAHRPLINPDRFPRTPPAGELRIIAVGESAVFGYPTGGELAFPHRLGVLLAERKPELSARVINAGVPGYDVRRTAKVVREVVDYGPSVIVMYTGHNEYLRRFAMENLRNLSPTVRLRQRLHKLRLYQLLIGVLRPVTGRVGSGSVDVQEETQEFAKREGFRQPRTPFETELVVNRYRSYIQQAIDSARDAGVHLILCTVVSNPKAFPKHTVYDAHLTEAEIKEAEGYRWKVKRAIKQDDLAAWEENAREGLRVAPGHAQFHHMLAQILEKNGELEQAKHHYIQARELEATQRRGGIAFNTAIRELGAVPGVTVVDLEKIFMADMEHGRWGEGLFSDYCHPNETGRDIIAEALYRAVDWEDLPRAR